jgi:hypothetical protein
MDGRLWGLRFVVIVSVAVACAALPGVWVQCSDPAVTLFHRPQAGIMIGSDQRFTLLTWATSGELVPEQGAENEGSLEYLDNGQFAGQELIQVDFVSDLGLTIIALPPVVTTAPRMLFIDNEGVETYTYAGVASVP